jgi:8-oxo-dGTP pyrophosphatase MutT (NUDIX family)
MTIKDSAAGVIVFRRNKNKLEYLLIKHGKGHWSFPKGHIDEGETRIQAAVRELKEETGITDIDLISKDILVEDYYAFRENGRYVEKTVEYFIGEYTPERSGKIKTDGKEITDFKWCGLKDSLKLLTFKESKNLLIKADSIIN